VVSVFAVGLKEARSEGRIFTAAQTPPPQQDAVILQLLKVMPFEENGDSRA